MSAPVPPIAETLRSLLVNEYGDQGWEDLGSLRRIVAVLEDRQAALLAEAWEKGFTAADHYRVEMHVAACDNYRVMPIRPVNPYRTEGSADRPSGAENWEGERITRHRPCGSVQCATCYPDAFKGVEE